jgi:colicin import membrane protein
VWLAGAGALLVIGWAFILIQNSFHLTAPVVFVCLGYGAGVASVYALFRTGASAASASEDDDEDAGWGRPVGARAELEREKKALLKAIKEAEFDLQMGKLSKADAEAMISGYRAQAIAVIREIDRKEGGDASAREQIEREVRARLEVAKAKKVAADADKRQQGKKGKKQPAAAKPAEPAKPAEQAEAAAKADEAATAAPVDPAAAKADEAATAAPVDPAAAKADEDAAAQADPAAAKADEAAGTDQPDETAGAKADEAQDAAAADPSNVEPKGAPAGAGVAKEATS